ncbi:MAG: YdcF family protein [Defluviitaleaceae bacterium]|nr:YdcF family protein [Defluviitaleaceae bacterium]
MRKTIILAGIITAIAAIRSVFISGATSNNALFLGGITVALGLYAWFFDRLKKMRWLNITIAILFVLILGFSGFLAVYGQRTTADFTEDVVIVLGAGILDGEPRPTLQSRLDQAVAYHQSNPDAIIIVSGGYGHGHDISEAEVMARYLVRHGVPPQQIILEDAAYSTYTNMSFSNSLLYEVFEGPFRSVIITSDFHMFRSGRFAQYQGIEATYYPASTPWTSIPFYYAREVAAIIKMWIIGR